MSLKTVDMKYYLSSYHLGNKPENFAFLFKESKKIGVIFNALDFSNDLDRKKKSIANEVKALKTIGLFPETLDLTEYFGETAQLRQKMAKLDGIWIMGGNTFILRRAMQESGLDDILIEYSQNEQKDNFVYGGYSAGVCVLSPSLKGIDLADDPVTIPKGYKKQDIWDGLGMINFYVAPHYKSDHPESETIEKTVNYYIENKMPFIALHDGEAVSLDSSKDGLVTFPEP